MSAYRSASKNSITKTLESSDAITVKSLIVEAIYYCVQKICVLKLYHEDAGRSIRCNYYSHCSLIAERQSKLSITTREESQLLCHRVLGSPFRFPKRVKVEFGKLDK
ncbi:hypothetical protein CEXT_202581 [Caerostris extrusa]|uniref:Uncharacterized protein n=1 Tax=Caerostris extrusa TaxID=172846 RepID=A0AAV4MDK5_CAEEX|nr:hypothetical protein CEXT_202581 [Caerostris extrusa]